MDSDDSSLSSAPSTDDEMAIMESSEKAWKSTPQKKKQGNILTFFKQKDRSPTPPKKKREPSPEHVLVPEDNPDIAFIVMFRSRFNEAFPRGAPTVGPQDVELGVAEGAPSSDVEGLLCGLLGLVLNRKKPVEKGHYGRALEEAIQTQKSQWPRAWGSTNPISGGRSFQTMTAMERITLLHTLSLWSLNQNEMVKAMVNDAYKARTTKDRLDTNIPLSVQPWGIDGDKRRYWLVEGQNDTHFRVYRETDPHKRKRVDWFSVAGDMDTLRLVADKLVDEDGRKDAKALSERMLNAVPRFEASEVKRKRREYRVNRNAAFIRPEPGFSMYEGRTRGKRLRYTYSDEEDFDSDVGARRSTRTSARETPAVAAGPTVTASGRQVRSRATGMYGESLLSGHVSDRASPATGDYVRSDVSEEPQQPHAHGRATRAAGRGATNGRRNRALDSDDATSWDGGDEDEDEPEGMVLHDDEDEADDSVSSSADEAEPNSLMVTLRYAKGSFDASNEANTRGISALDIADLNGTEDPAQCSGAPLAGHGEPRQPVQHATPPVEPAAHATLDPAPVLAAANQVHTGNSSLSRPVEAHAVAPSPATLSPPSPSTLPKPEALFPVVPANYASACQAPTRSVQYSAVQPIVAAQAQQQHHHHHHHHHHHQSLTPIAQHQAQQQSQAQPQPPFASATNWQ